MDAGDATDRDVPAAAARGSRRRFITRVGSVLLICAGVSLGVHVGAGATAGWYLGRHRPSGAPDPGERGQRGAGGSTVDISVAGPTSAPITPAPAASAPEAAPAQPSAPAPPTPFAAPPPVQPPMQHARVHPPLPRPPPQHRPAPAATELAHAPPMEPEPPPLPPEPTPGDSPGRVITASPSGGTGAETTSGGASAGSVGAQRARLPQATQCNDTVAGVWRAHTYSPQRNSWAMFTLRIQHEAHGVLAGTMTAREWIGGPLDSRPLACALSDGDLTVRMTGHGFLQGQRIEFGGSAPAIHVNCPFETPVTYNPDQFTGSVDFMRQEFQSVNNDGGWAVNERVVFRRVSCLDGDPTTEE